MELPFAGLHQLCGSLLDRLGSLPVPQRDALGTAFGLSSGTRPDRFLISLAVLSLLSEAADERALLCLVDDAQWLDRSSAQVLAFVARRVKAESVVLMFAVREPLEPDEFARLPDLRLQGLSDADARHLLASVIGAPLDERVRGRILAEARGNPLALLELPRSIPVRAGGRLRPATGRRRSRPGSRQASGAAWSNCPMPRNDSCCWPPPSRQVRRHCCGGRRRSSGSPSMRWAPPSAMACSSSARGSPSATHCCVPRSIGPRRLRLGEARIEPWLRPPTLRPIPTAGRGTSRGRRSRPMRKSPTSWSVRLGGRRRGAEFRQPRHSSSAPPISPSTPESEHGGRWKPQESSCSLARPRRR